MTDRRQEQAYARNPQWCQCTNTPDAPSTHRAPAHFTACRHSTLRETTRGRPAPRLRRLPGTRGVTVNLNAGWGEL
jgi:hypothetical protein